MYKLVFELQPLTARTVYDAFERVEEPKFCALTLAENEHARWSVELFFLEKPDGVTDLGVANDLTSCTPQLMKIEDEDWVAKSQMGLAPVQAGCFFIHGSHDRTKARGKFYAIEIDARQAFGTAHHGTTKGCLLAIDELSRSHFLKSDFRVLDLGTGSGVLAIAAARKFQRKILASDLDPDALAIAAENFITNKAGQLARVVLANGFSHPSIRQFAPFDLVIANVLAGPLKIMAPDFRRNVAKRGHLLLSGILNKQAPQVMARFRSFGFVPLKRYEIEGWSTIMLRRVLTLKIS